MTLVGESMHACVASVVVRGSGRYSKWSSRRAFSALIGRRKARKHGDLSLESANSADRGTSQVLPLAVQRLQTILESPETADGDALRAVGMLMDRTGLGPQSDITVELKPWERLLAGRRTAASSGRSTSQRSSRRSATRSKKPVLDAEVVDDSLPVDRDVEALSEPSAPVMPVRVGSANPPCGSPMVMPSASRRR